MTFEDDDIRSRLRVDTAGVRSPASAPVVLEQLMPRLRRARRRRRILIGATGVVLIGAAGAALQSSLDTSSSSAVRMNGANGHTAGVDEHTAGSGPTDDRDPSSAPERPSESPGYAATTVAGLPTSTSASAPASPGVGVPASPIPGSTTLPAAQPTIAVVDPTTPTADPVQQPPATSTSQAPVVPTGTNQRIDSACGAVVVQLVDDRVELVEVLANPGFAVDVKSDGPTNVEVGLHGGNDECELKARIVGGQLVTEVHGPGGDDDAPDD